MNARLLLVLAILLESVSGCIRNPDDLINGKIISVEQGLISEYSDPPWARMELSERMAHYLVPGVSIAVINDFRIEWAKGYGVSDAILCKRT